MKEAWRINPGYGYCELTSKPKIGAHGLTKTSVFMCFQTETSYLNRQSAIHGKVKILEVYCISLIRDPNSTENQTTCVNR